MDEPLPLTRDVVLIGGGHTHALVLRAWGMNPLPGARLTLVSPEPVAPYSGMLPGLVAGHYRREALMIDLVRLVRFAGARLVLGRAEGLDRARREVLLSGRAPLRYDIASLDIGVTSDMPDLPGFARHAHPAKPLGPFAEAWAAHLARVAQGGPAEAVVIGGGVAGTELALAMAYRLGPGRVTLVEAGPTPLPGLSPGARRAVLAEAARLGLSLRTGAAAVEVGPGQVRLAGGETLPSAFTCGAAGARAQGWLAATGLALHEGFVAVGPTLASTNDPAVFAAGDCAHLTHAPRPKAGVFAVRAAPVLFDNLRAALTGTQPRRFRPQRDYLRLVSCGGRRAVADRSGLHAAGGWVWRWKDRIDRRFMDRFAGLAPMGAGTPPDLAALGAREEAAGRPLCGGCAAKVGRGALAAALASLPAPGRPDVLAGPGDDAAVLRTGGATQVLTTDTLRAFTHDWWLLARIAAVHALGDVWAMGAAPQAVLAQVVLPRMSAPLQTATLAEILAAARGVFDPEGAAIVGGHSALGAELSVGFTVTGLAQGPVTGLAGARPGDALILTKALGTGVILAAEMAMRARGAHVAAALAAMARPQGEAARLLAPRARAMTDVTGFGLAGHLAGLLAASGVSARLDLAALPVLDGALDLLAAGIRSTLHAANADPGVPFALPPGPRAELLLDPQTAGGLLAAVPEDEAPGLVAALRGLGLPAAVIGRIAEGPPAIAAA
ncbi:MAG: selenide, water dikinase SelD [Rhodobacteraceae bacterium]|nr:selenide, water dikinase SelD [Paracoccaceae bacterium]